MILEVLNVTQIGLLLDMVGVFCVYKGSYGDILFGGGKTGLLAKFFDTLGLFLLIGGFGLQMWGAQ